MVIVLKNRAAIYQREAAEMLHNISLYPGLTENQLCRFFPEKEATAKVLLAHMLKEGRVFCDRNGGYYANQEAQNGADKDLSRCVWVLLDFIDQVEYHTVGEFPAAILCFANGELYEIVPIPQGKETMICQLLRQPQKDAGKRIVVLKWDAVPVLDAGGLDAFQRFVKKLPEGCELRVSNLEFQPLRTMARAGIQPIPGRLAFFPNKDAALADIQ